MHLRHLLLLIGASTAIAEKFCYTALAAAAAPAKLATSVTTTKTPCVTTVTKHRTVTKTPKAKTTMVITTSTSTVTSSLTDTATVTNTSSTATQTSTSTETDTETQTETTVVTSTSTVPASAGFIPVSSSLPGSGYDGAGGIPPLDKRDHVKDLKKRAKKGNPQKVDCLVVEAAAKCKTVTSTTIKTIVHTTPTTKTKTSTVTASTTEFPSATVTTTVYTDTTTSTTVTTTETETVDTTTTSYAAGPTLYGACDSNNIVDQVNGQIIGQIYNYAQEVGGGYSQASASTAYDCCVAGLFSTPYPGAVWQFIAQSQQCFINNINPADYPQSQSDQSWEVSAENTGTTLVVGNLYYATINQVAPS